MRAGIFRDMKLTHTYPNIASSVKNYEKMGKTEVVT
jgi:hypothetical protein